MANNENNKSGFLPKIKSVISRAIEKFTPKKSNFMSLTKINKIEQQKLGIMQKEHDTLGKIHGIADKSSQKTFSTKLSSMPSSLQSINDKNKKKKEGIIDYDTDAVKDLIKRNEKENLGLKKEQIKKAVLARDTMLSFASSDRYYYESKNDKGQIDYKSIKIPRDGLSDDKLKIFLNHYKVIVGDYFKNNDTTPVIGKISNIEKQISTLKSSIQKLESDLQNLKTKSDIDAKSSGIENKINELNRNIDRLNDNLTKERENLVNTELNILKNGSNINALKKEDINTLASNYENTMKLYKFFDERPMDPTVDKNSARINNEELGEKISKKVGKKIGEVYGATPTLKKKILDESLRKIKDSKIDVNLFISQNLKPMEKTLSNFSKHDIENEKTDEKIPKRYDIPENDINNIDNIFDIVIKDKKNKIASEFYGRDKTSSNIEDWARRTRSNLGGLNKEMEDFEEILNQNVKMNKATSVNFYSPKQNNPKIPEVLNNDGRNVVMKNEIPKTDNIENQEDNVVDDELDMLRKEFDQKYPDFTKHGKAINDNKELKKAFDDIESKVNKITYLEDGEFENRSNEEQKNFYRDILNDINAFNNLYDKVTEQIGNEMYGDEEVKPEEKMEQIPKEIAIEDEEEYKDDFEEYVEEIPEDIVPEMETNDQNNIMSKTTPTNFYNSSNMEKDKEILDNNEDLKINSRIANMRQMDRTKATKYKPFEYEDQQTKRLSTAGSNVVQGFKDNNNKNTDKFGQIEIPEEIIGYEEFESRLKNLDEKFKNRSDLYAKIGDKDSDDLSKLRQEFEEFKTEYEQERKEFDNKLNGDTNKLDFNTYKGMIEWINKMNLEIDYFATGLFHDRQKVFNAKYQSLKSRIDSIKNNNDKEIDDKETSSIENEINSLINFGQEIDKEKESKKVDDEQNLSNENENNKSSQESYKIKVEQLKAEYEKILEDKKNQETDVELTINGSSVDPQKKEQTSDDKKENTEIPVKSEEKKNHINSGKNLQNHPNATVVNKPDVSLKVETGGVKDVKQENDGKYNGKIVVTPKEVNDYYKKVCTKLGTDIKKEERGFYQSAKSYLNQFADDVKDKNDVNAESNDESVGVNVVSQFKEIIANANKNEELKKLLEGKMTIDENGNIQIKSARQATQLWQSILDSEQDPQKKEEYKKVFMAMAYVCDDMVKRHEKANQLQDISKLFRDFEEKLKSGDKLESKETDKEVTLPIENKRESENKINKETQEKINKWQKEINNLRDLDEVVEFCNRDEDNNDKEYKANEDEKMQLWNTLSPMVDKRVDEIVRESNIGYEDKKNLDKIFGDPKLPQDQRVLVEANIDSKYRDDIKQAYENAKSLPKEVIKSEEIERKPPGSKINEEDSINTINNTKGKEVASQEQNQNNGKNSITTMFESKRTSEKAQVHNRFL